MISVVRESISWTLLKAACAALGWITSISTMPQFAPAWILNNRAVTSVICGATSVKQLEENLGATEVQLTEQELLNCDEVWHKLRPSKFFYGSQQLIR